MIIRNSAKCLDCGVEIESKSRHDYVTCGCPNSAMVDGGRVYLRGGGMDLSRVQDTSIEKTFDTVEELMAQFAKYHSVEECQGPTCTIHNPTEHHMSTWPYDWEDQIVRVCPHNMRHPDPDGLRISAYHREYGCDGCCWVDGDEQA